MTIAPAPRRQAARVASALDLLDGAGESLLDASHAEQVVDRYAAAHLAALRAAAAVLAVHVPRRPADGGSGGPRNVWELVPAVAPELGEWAVFFAYSGKRRWALEDGVDFVTVREADDLLRSAQEFLDLVRGTLGLPRHTEALRLAPADPVPEL